MAVGLAALLDDIALIAKAAASSVDDVVAAAGRTSAKAAGVVIDDAAVTPRFVQGVTPARELPIVLRIAKGSLINKLVFILPVALLLSSFAPWLLTPLLMLGGAYLCYEGAEKIVEKVTENTASNNAVKNTTEENSAGDTPDRDEDILVRSAVTTDFILSTEIMVISLNEVATQPLAMRAAVLFIVGIVVTIGVYGAVGALVKMDDIGLAMLTRESPRVQAFGKFLVAAMPKVLAVISVIGMLAMLWVGGHILLDGMHELFWAWPYDTVHHLTEHFSHGAVQWVVNTFFSMIAGLIAGLIIVGIMHLLPKEHNA